MRTRRSTIVHLYWSTQITEKMLYLELQKACKSVSLKTMTVKKLHNDTVFKFFKQRCCVLPISNKKKNCKRMRIPWTMITSSIHCVSLMTTSYYPKIMRRQSMSPKLIEEYRKWRLEVEVKKMENIYVGGNQDSWTLEDKQRRWTNDTLWLDTLTATEKVIDFSAETSKAKSRE